MPVQAVNQNDYNDSVADYVRGGWQVIDDTLYRLCREYPKHDDELSINAKVLLIGRTYTTGIERKIATRGTQGSSLSQVVDIFFQHHNEIDRYFVHLRKVSEPLDPLKIRKMLMLHGLLVNLLRQLTIQKQSVRTFISKYIHFHNPAVPIYDNIAANFLPSLVPLRKIKHFTIRPTTCADPEYVDYVRRFAALYFASQSQAVTVRSLDYYLLYLKWKTCTQA